MNIGDKVRVRYNSEMAPESHFMKLHNDQAIGVIKQYAVIQGHDWVVEFDEEYAQPTMAQIAQLLGLSPDTARSFPFKAEELELV